MVEENIICEYSGLRSLAFYLKEQEKEDAQKNTDFNEFSSEDIDRIIQMAWEDRTPFEAIEFQFGLKEKDVINFMRKNSKPSSFRMWRRRMQARSTKHSAKRHDEVTRFKCSRQKSTGNRISKR
jgi:uncharacterized protein (TIGR03643 family)